MQTILCFHKPEEPYGFLSNWYPSQFKKDGVVFSSMEPYKMYYKAICFHDTKTAADILHTDNAGAIKAFGRAVKNYDNIIWNGYRQLIVYEGLLEKFQQNEMLQEKLLATGNAILAECAVQDMIWGIGLSMRDEKRFSMRAWRGQNLLGFTLMQVREKYKSEI